MKKIPMFLMLFISLILLGGCGSQPASNEPIDGRVEKYIDDYNKDNSFSGSILVAEGGNVVFKKSYGMADYEKKLTNSADTKFRIGSITKQFTAMSIMILQEKGLLNVNDKVSKFISDYPRGNEISIHNLMSMSSGITNDVPGLIPAYDFYSGTYVNGGKGTRKDEHFTPEGLMELFKNKPLNFKPGEKFEYSNSNYVILGYIIEKISNMSYGDFVKNNIFIPLEMKNSGYDNNEVLENSAVGYDKLSPQAVKTLSYDMSIFYSCGALYSTLEDLYKWDKALYTDKLVKKDTLASIFKPYTKIEEYPYHSYGYGWVVSDLSSKVQAEHDGELPGFSSFIYHGEGANRSIIILSNNMSFTAKRADFFTGILNILNSKK